MSLETARLAVGVDLAAVEGAALLLVAQNFVGRIDLGEFRLRLGVVGVLVGMVLLGELAERLFHIRLRGVLGDAENLVGIAHCPKAHLAPARSAAPVACLS